jgi:hypothetical protein
MSDIKQKALIAQDADLTDLIKRLEALEAKATKGPWHLHNGGFFGSIPWIGAGNWERQDGSYVRGGCILNMVAHEEREQDAALIIELRNNLPAIIATLRAQEASHDR